MDRLVNKKTPKSRKYKSKKGPKYDNRKRRIVEDDKDLNINTVEGDRDLSLNYKYSSDDILSFISVKIASDIKPLERAVEAYVNDLRKSSPTIADEFLKYANKKYLKPAMDGSSQYPDDGVSEIKDHRRIHLKLKNDLQKRLLKSSPEVIVSTIGSIWPSGDRNDFGTRAAIIGALDKAIGSVRLPEALKVPFLRNNVKEFVNDKKFIRRIIESSKNFVGSAIKEDLVPRFAQLAAAYQMVVSNPDTIDIGKMQQGIGPLSDSISEQFQELTNFNALMQTWHEALASIKHEPQKVAELGKSSSDYDQIISSIGSFFKKGNKLIDISPYLDEMKNYAKDEYGLSPDEALIPDADYEHDVNPEGKSITLEDDNTGDINPDKKPVSFDDEESDGPEEVSANPILEGKELERVVQHYVDLLEKALEGKNTNDINKYLKELHKEIAGNLDEDVAKVASRRRATSNRRNLDGRMNPKTAAYHGVVDQKGNPLDPPNTGFKSYDKRYFDKRHYDRIIKAAQDFLKSDWLSTGWDKGAPDAPIRAALDLSIHLADNGLYQSKVDVETYNYLLNKLAKWNWDTFSDTLLPFKNGNGRSASMKPEHQVMLKIANDIRLEHPEKTLSILKSIKSLASEEPQMSDTPETPENTAAGDLGKNPFVMEFKSMDDEDFKKLHGEVKQVLDQRFDEKDVQDFLDGFDDLFEKLQTKVASCGGGSLINALACPVPFSRLASVVTLTASDLADLKKIGEKHASKIASASGPMELVIHTASLLRDIQKRVSLNIQAGVPMGDLVKLANDNPSLRASLLPLVVKHRDIIAAKVKKSKKKPVVKKDEKKDPKKDEKAKAEKLPKTSKGKGKSKKATVASTDLDW